jgi:hypothetical protein
MSRLLTVCGSIAVLSVMWASVCAAQDPPHPDFSLLDPAWAAQQLDNSFQSGPASPAWKALKAGFPEDYKRLLGRMARAMIANQDWSPLSGDFIAQHTVGQIAFAAKAPARNLVRYQKLKATLIEHLASTNVPACAAIASGALPSIPTDGPDPTGAQMLYEVLGAFVDAAAAGHVSPQSRGAVTTADLAALRSIMVMRGTPEADATRALSTPPSAPDREKCHAAVLMHVALASAPEDLVAKLAIIAPR